MDVCITDSFSTKLLSPNVGLVTVNFMRITNDEVKAICNWFGYVSYLTSGSSFVAIEKATDIYMSVQEPKFTIGEESLVLLADVKGNHIYWFAIFLGSGRQLWSHISEAIDTKEDMLADLRARIKLKLTSEEHKQTNKLIEMNKKMIDSMLVFLNRF